MSLIRAIFFKWFGPSAYGEDAKTGAPPRRELYGAPQTDETYGASSFKMAGTTEEAIYRKLVAVAKGDTHQVLPAMDAISRGHDVDETFLFDHIKEVGRTRPYEAGHLMARLFDRATIKTRLAIIGELVLSSKVGDKYVVGDLFIKLLESSTVDERRGEIYPGLLAIINDGTSKNPVVMSKRAFLAALLKGWMSEI